MKPYKYILTLILSLITGTAFSHQDFWTIKDFGNVKVRIKTGFYYEEIKKVFLLGQLAQRFAKDLKYSEPIFLDFNHYYVGNCEPDYFISYDKGKIGYTWNGANEEKDLLKEKAIVIRQIDRYFDAHKTLILLEYAILNLSTVKASQKQIEYNKNYCQWRINSIDTASIKKLFDVPNSEKINNALDLKIYPDGEDFKYGISYYLKANKYIVFTRIYDKRDTDLFILNNIHAIKKLDSSTAIIFDTDSSFYYLNQFKPVSKRHIINNTNKNFIPLKIESMGGNKISIYFSYYSQEDGKQPREGTLIYLVNQDKLIQDLEKLIDK